MAGDKFEPTSSFQEYDPLRAKHLKTFRTLESIRLGLTVLALLSAITVVGVSADTLGVYNTTHLGQEYFLSLWPDEFDIRPTIALVTCSSVIVVASTIAIVASKVPAVRHIPLMHLTTSFASPIVILVGGLIGTSFFYGVNASDTVNSLKSWSCQWESIDMTIKPHWSTLCKESKVGLYLTVMMIPLGFVILGVSTMTVFAAKKMSASTERKGSPALS